MRPCRNVVDHGLNREPRSYGVGDGEASVSFFFLEDFFVVDFFVVCAVVLDFFVVAALALLVVIDSVLLAHDDIKTPTATRAAMEQIRDCFIGCA